MRLVISIISILQFVLLFYSCSSTLEDQKVEYALSISGNNREELIKVLDYYKNDPQKLKAAKYLIGNMPGHHYVLSSDQEKAERKLEASVPRGYVISETIDEENIKPYYKKYIDLEVVTSDYLINNIELAFEVWVKPWNRDLSFDDFCYYILPYRAGNEEITDWRRLFKDEFMPKLEHELKDTLSTLSACSVMIDLLKKHDEFIYNGIVSHNSLSATFLFNRPVGNCRDACELTLHAMRSVGIPVAIDLYHYSPEYQGSHTWNVVRDNDGEFIPFWYTQFYPVKGNPLIDGRKKGKVFREFYSFDLQNSQMLIDLFKNNKLKDVTGCYCKDSVVVEHQITGLEEGDHYIGIFSPRKWVVIDQSKSDLKSRSIFKYLERNIFYQPLIKKDEYYVESDFPYLLLRDSLIRLQPGGKNKDIILRRKMPMSSLWKMFSDDLIKGMTIEGSNDVAFIDSDTIIVIKEKFESNRNDIKCESSNKYRYLRLSAPLNKELELAEIEIWTENNKKLSKVDYCFAKPLRGRVFSSNKENADVLFDYMNNLKDGDILTYFASKDSSASLVMDLFSPVKLSKIMISQRNDDNYITPGDTYELFYHTGKSGWKSLGEKVSEADSLVYSAPVNSLLWLRNLSKGKEEQVFISHQGKQIFAKDLNDDFIMN